MNLKSIVKLFICPHIAVMIVLLPLSAVMLVGSMVFVGSESSLAIPSYVFSAYTLTVWCVRMPRIIAFFSAVKRENKYSKMWVEDARLRVKISLYGSFFGNTVYALFLLWLGFYHRTFWFYSLGTYYICLALMRFSLLSHTRKYSPGEKMREEILKYRASGYVLLIMNLALAIIVFFMIYWNRSFEHHEITAIAMAAYTFASLSVAIVGIFKYRRYNSPVFSASKIISLISALVSMLTLESTMLTAFGKETASPLFQKLMLGITGGAVSTAITSLSVYMIIKSTRLLRKHGENGYIKTTSKF